MGKRMKVIEPKQVDILSSLGEDMKAIESQRGVDNNSDLNEAREAVVAAIRGVRESLYWFAESLDCYRTFFKTHLRGANIVLRSRTPDLCARNSTAS